MVPPIACSVGAGCLQSGREEMTNKAELECRIVGRVNGDSGRGLYDRLCAPPECRFGGASRNKKDIVGQERRIRSFCRKYLLQGNRYLLLSRGGVANDLAFVLSGCRIYALRHGESL